MNDSLNPKADNHRLSILPSGMMECHLCQRVGWAEEMEACDATDKVRAEFDDRFSVGTHTRAEQRATAAKACRGWSELTDQEREERRAVCSVCNTGRPAIKTRKDGRQVCAECDKAVQALSVRAQAAILTEAQWSELYRDYEGDGSVPTARLIVEWDDPSETPSQAIQRLNREAVANAARH